MPSAIEQVQREYRERGLVVLAVNLQERREKVSTWARERQLTSTIVFDPTGAIARAYQVTVTPTTFIVGRDGKLVGKALGTKGWSTPKGRQLFHALLDP